jgi:uncharacterized protein
MAGPLSGKGGLGCLVTMALASLLGGLFFTLQPDRQAVPGASRLAAAAQTPLQAGQKAGQGPRFPSLTGRVVDAANIIPDDAEARLDQKLAALQTQSGRQLVVTTLPSLEGYDISDYGYQLGRAWGIGSKEKNDGALLIVAPNERKLRVEVGYGLEGILTDGLSSIIINETIVPRFKAGDMAGGIEAGTDALIAQLTLPEDQARLVAAQAKPSQHEGDGLFPLVFFSIFFFFFILLPMLRRGRGQRHHSSGLGPVILWGIADAIASGRSSSGGGWSGGGGGFSGGGGSFGGGGSSGSW